MKLTLFHKGLIVLSLPLIAQIVLAGVLLDLHDKTELEVTKEKQARMRYEAVNQLPPYLVELAMIAQKEQFERKTFDVFAYNVVRAKIDMQFKVIDEAVKGDHQLSAAAYKAHQDFAQGVVAVDRIVAAYDAHDDAKVQRLLKSTQMEIKTHLKAMSTSRLFSMAKEQKALMEQSPETQRQFRRQTSNSIVVFLVVTTTITIFLWILFHRGITRRLDIMMKNSIHLAKGEPLERPLEGADQIAELDRTFHRTAEELHEIERMKQEVVNMVTHDLKAPLSAVDNFLDILEMGVGGTLDEKGLSMLKAAQRSCGRMAALINELLDLEKIKSGMMELNIETIKLMNLLEQAAESVPAWGRKEQVQIDIEPTELSIRCDPDRIVQVLVNLLSNAIKFSPPGTSVSLAATQADDSIEIAVTDKGRGIPTNALPHIFDSFTQVDRGDAIQKGGTGLGLAICKAIVNLHGGSIAVTSAERAGSKFVISIPRQRS